MLTQGWHQAVENQCGLHVETTDRPFSSNRKEIKQAIQVRRGQHKELLFDVQKEAQEVHMVPRIEHNLMWTNKFVLAMYVIIFDGDMLNIYNATNTNITVLRGAIL